MYSNRQSPWSFFSNIRPNEVVAETVDLQSMYFRQAVGQSLRAFNEEWFGRFHLSRCSLNRQLDFLRNAGGSRTHRHEALDLAAFPVCVPGRQVAGPGVAPGRPGL